MSKKQLFSMLLLFVGVSIQAQSVATEQMDERFNTNVEGLHCLGDSSGWTRGLMMASIMGALMGRKLA